MAASGLEGGIDREKRLRLRPVGSEIVKTPSVDGRERYTGKCDSGPKDRGRLWEIKFRSEPSAIRFSQRVRRFGAPVEGDSSTV